MSDELMRALLVAATSIVVALIGLAGLRMQANKPSVSKPPVNTTGDTPLARFDGTQNEFMSIVINDNADLRRQLTQLKEDVEAIKKFQETFVDAVRRYLKKLHRYWGAPGSMPPPDDADLVILAKALPLYTEEVTIPGKEKL